MKHEVKTDVMETLVAALISVNRWTLEKSYEIKEALARNGLFDAHLLSTLNSAQISSRLLLAGYTKPEFVRNLIAERLHLLGLSLADGQLRRLEALVVSRDVRAVESFLSKIKGVGPVVLGHFKMLQNLP
jgi:hypothetical protein